jgi:hypothetical protein
MGNSSESIVRIPKQAGKEIIHLMTPDVVNGDAKQLDRDTVSLWRCIYFPFGNWRSNTTNCGVAKLDRAHQDLGDQQGPNLFSMQDLIKLDLLQPPQLIFLSSK